jgi:hypothetical protein
MTETTREGQAGPADVRTLGPGTEGPAGSAAVKEVAEWIGSYLCASHSKLGRDGPVCPFTPLSVKKRLLWVAVDPASDPLTPYVREGVAKFAETFFALEPRDGTDERLKAIVIAFPAVRDCGRLDALQEQLKPEFVRRGLMIGQFHPQSDDPGLWNPDFRPLRSPVPLLAIRHMVPGDLRFLTGHPRWIEPYLNKYAPDIPAQLRSSIARAIASYSGDDALNLLPPLATNRPDAQRLLDEDGATDSGLSVRHPPRFRVG